MTTLHAGGVTPPAPRRDLTMTTRYYHKLDGLRVQCDLCPAACIIPEGKTGRCNTRYNDHGALESLISGKFFAVSIDPIEKKPLAHFFPGSQTFSVGTMGCNLSCPFCQNSALSQLQPCHLPQLASMDSWTPQRLILETTRGGCASIAFTYSEPLLGLEFASQVYAERRGPDPPLVFVTNGQISGGPLQDLCTIAAGANVDLKAMSRDTYTHTLGGNRDATLDTIAALHANGCWLEITTLVVPRMNDSEREMKEIARFIAHLDVNIPWHVSRFHPAWQYDKASPTAVSQIERICHLGRDAGLHYVYAGNVPGHNGEQTRCPTCNNTVIHRRGYRLESLNTTNGQCNQCGTDIAGVGFP